MNRFRSNFQIWEEEKAQKRDERNSAVQEAQKLAAPLSDEQGRIQQVLTTIWDEFANARRLFYARIKPLEGFAGFSLMANKNIGGLDLFSQVWSHLTDEKVGFLLRPSVAGGWILEQPRNWRRLVKIDRDAEDLADELGRELGKPVTLMVGCQVIYRTQSEIAEGIIPLRAKA